MRVLLGLAMLCAAINCIGIPLNPMVNRCMIAYTSDKYETLKLDIKFPALP